MPDYADLTKHHGIYAPAWDTDEGLVSVLRTEGQEMEDGLRRDWVSPRDAALLQHAADRIEALSSTKVWRVMREEYDNDNYRDDRPDDSSVVYATEALAQVACKEAEGDDERRHEASEDRKSADWDKRREEDRVLEAAGLRPVGWHKPGPYPRSKYHCRYYVEDIELRHG